MLDSGQMQHWRNLMITHCMYIFYCFKLHFLWRRYRFLHTVIMKVRLDSSIQRQQSSQCTESLSYYEISSSNRGFVWPYFVFYVH